MVNNTIYHVILGNNVVRKLDFKRSVQTWKDYGSDYKIVCITDKHYEELVKRDKIPWFIQECYDNEIYALVTDYLRFLIMSSHSGLWLDSDVSLVNSIPSSYLQTDILLPMDVPNYLVPGYRINAEILGVSERGKGLVRQMLAAYKESIFDLTVNQVSIENEIQRFMMNFFGFTSEFLENLQFQDNICRMAYQDYTVTLYYDDKDYKKKSFPVFTHDKEAHWVFGTKRNIEWEG